MGASAVVTILVKELREVLRDRRTLLLMIGIPVFLYPALFVLMEQVLLFGQGSISDTVPRIALDHPADWEVPAALAGAKEIELVPLRGAGPELIGTGRFDAVLRVETPPRPEVEPIDVRLFYDASRDLSVHARTLMTERLDAMTDEILERRLERLGLPARFARPVAVADTSIATPKGLGGAALGRFLPMILVIMTVLGAFHPAIDIAAGERERRTLEPLLATSAPARSIILGKYFAVALIAFTAAALNLASMLLTLNAGLFQFATEYGLEFDLPPGAIAAVLALLVLLALLFSALFLGIAVQAQSFREAQTMLTPVYLLSFLPTIVTMAPGIAFTDVLAFVPVAGIALVFRALMMGEPIGYEGFLAVTATIGYAALALYFAARTFAREDVLIGGDEEAEVIANRRYPWWNRNGSPVPSPAAALIFAGLVAALFFYVGLSFARWGEVGILASQWLLLAAPVLLFLRIGRFDWRATLAVRPAPPRAFVGALLVLLGGLPLGWLIAWFQTSFIALPEDLLAGLEGLLTADGAGRAAWLVLLVAATPALCEEIVFRGVLLQGFLRRASPTLAIFGSAAVFGLFHVSYETVIRLFPTLFLGILLALVAYRTRSILPTILMHFVNNSIAVLLVSRPELQRYLVVETGAPNWLIVVGGLVLFVVGLRVLPSAATPAGAVEGVAEARGPAVPA